MKCSNCGSEDVSTHFDENEIPVTDDYGNSYLECEDCGAVDTVDEFQRHE